MWLNARIPADYSTVKSMINVVTLFHLEQVYLQPIVMPYERLSVELSFLFSLSIFFFIIYSICAKKILFSNINWLKMNYQYHFLHRERKKTENTTLKTITTMHYEHFSFENKLMPDIWLYEDARLPLSYNKEDRRKWCTFELPTYVFCCFYLTWNIRSCNMNDIA